MELTEESTDVEIDSIPQLVEQAARLLPTQGPLEVFVYRNNLEAFEHLPFDQGVRAALSTYGAEPYLTERRFRDLRRQGRITDSELEAVVRDDLGPRCGEEVNGLGSLLEIRLAMLCHPLHIGPDAELRWVVAETDALERFREQTSEINRARMISAARKWLETSADRADQFGEIDELLTKFGRDSSKWTIRNWEAFTLRLLWRICLNGVGDEPAVTRRSTSVRPRDLLLHTTGEDVDRDVHGLLIRFCSAYLDQGYSDWVLPNRDVGFFEAFVELYSTSAPGIDRWLQLVPRELAALKREGVTAEESVLRSLVELGIAEEQREEFITQTLLSLGGWAGMIWQLESGIDWVVHRIPKGSLTGLLAVQLILERHAMCHLGRQQFGVGCNLHEILSIAGQHLAEPVPLNRERQAFLLFQVAQMLGWTPLELLQLSAADWRRLSDEVDDFPSFERRRVFHEAYERNYRYSVLDAVAIHSARRRAMPIPWRDRPEFQLMTCIDDREESFRRHLEEVRPTCQTFGAAGFFAVAMYYRGAADGFYKPLCPAVVTPAHYVQEDVGYTFEGAHQSRALIRRQLGLFSRAFHTRSRTFLGGIVTGIVGSLATAPLVARVLFPRMTARIQRRFGSLIQPPPVTQLQLERFDDPPGPANGHVGYSTQEMANVVVRLLQEIGLTRPEDFSRLFIVCGHGSSSLNNPHESSYCCGACAGKRGGPNARAFAQMANDWRVRALVAEQGIAIPADTTFVGAYHDTCEDSVVFYDLDRLPT
ncbi:MAG: DUF2309 family protein, partial [Planctomycetaceae bacterium]|nr:DUF2309 family protein [Planctomycetaceae bacterium]